MGEMRRAIAREQEATNSVPVRVHARHRGLDHCRAVGTRPGHLDTESAALESKQRIADTRRLCRLMGKNIPGSVIPPGRKRSPVKRQLVLAVLQV
jgi:hypothetical protein